MEKKKETSSNKQNNNNSNNSSDALSAVIPSENTAKPTENVKVLTFLNDWAKPY